MLNRARWPRSLLKGYPLAVWTVALCFLLRWGLEPVLQEDLPFGLFLFPVLVMAWRGDLYSSLFAAGLGLLGGLWFYARLPGPLAAPGGADWIAMGNYLLAALLICWYAEKMRRAKGSLEQAAARIEAQQQVLRAQLAEHEQTEAALSESEQHRRAVLEAIPHLVWTARVDGSRDYLSQQWEQYTGLTAAQGMGESWLGCIHPEDRQGVREKWEAAFRTGSDTGYEFRLRGSDGVYRWFRSRAIPLRDPEGRIVKWFGTATEISDIVTARQVLENRQQELEQLVRERTAEVERLKSKLQEENFYLREKISLGHSHSRFVGKSAAIRRVLAQAEQVAPTDSTVLLLGETGTGKELIAATLHELSARRGGTLVSVNCAAMPSPLVESELFGREKGAFTGSLSRQIGRFELADRSTIFLDEIGELSPETQSKLLRVLENKQFERLGNPKPVTVDVRVIAATNRDLESAVREGKFRQDLYYRLNVFPIVVPPLRDRREDIPLLVWAFVDEFAKLFNKNIESIEKGSLDALQRYSWPGNVRELRNLIERAMIVATGPKLKIPLASTPAALPMADSRKLEEVERQHILAVLEKSGWRIRGDNGAAGQLGLKPTTLEARMARLGIRRPVIAEV